MKKHWAVVGLGFGDEGKGSIVDFLCATERVDYVVRFNGGCQAAHNVVLPDGTHHTFSQYGSGVLSGVRSILSRFMSVEPLGFLAETAALKTFDLPAVPRMPLVDSRCLITTPWHMAYNRMQEKGRDRPHGTCGLGVGATVEFMLEHEWAAPRAGDIMNEGDIKWKLKALALWAKEQGVEDEYDIDEILRAYRRFKGSVLIVDSGVIHGMINTGACVFEGAQGVLLDEWCGFHPHTTWSTTTFENIAHLVDDMDTVDRIGVVRSYMTRHGAGPFPTEDVKLKAIIPEAHNDDEGMQGWFRVGDFDLPLLRYAVGCCRHLDIIALTHLDVFDDLNLKDVCVGYTLDGVAWGPTPPEVKSLKRQEAYNEVLKRVQPLYTDLKESGDSLVDLIEREVGVPVRIVSGGPTSKDKGIRFPEALVN